ncbi:hypothetical protein QBC37DRAFT_407962 [Rhypophila decipiens]|uniref:N-acetyltransferase domain-containing protein n=1 Tax=Rhypophila decipiens TaxID=261697 RepID=A0AAN7BBW3_9PEZI|nr:hypothetical protein QBC37DRAFT_407962 [Rhypophila decipiens]
MASSQPAAAAAAAGYHKDEEDEEATNKNRPDRRITLIDTPPTASDELVTELKRHLPFSIPVLRRIQFANKFPGPPGSTEFAHVLWAFYEEEEDEQKHFAAAYVDLSRGPETQCWIYCTLEDSFSDSYYYETTTAPSISGVQDGWVLIPTEEEQQSQADELVLTILRRMWEISSSQQQQQERPDDGGNSGAKQHTVLIGSLHETIRKRLLDLGVKMFKTKNVPAEIDWEFCNKWLFRVEDFPPAVIPTIPGGAGDSNKEILSLPWTNNKNPNKNFTDSSSRTSETTVQLKLKFDKVKKSDIPLIRARTSIDRKPETLLRLPSLVLRRLSFIPSPSPSNNNSREEEEEEKEEDAVAWAFTGLDGTLMTLHVEPAYRGLGLAKLIACKIMKDSLPLYGDDGWGAADVFVANTQSQGVCKSIGGKAWWTLSWAVVDLDSVPGLPTYLGV